MSETTDYIEESEDYAERGGETPLTGEDVIGGEGELVLAIPAANYPAGKTATAKDADLTAGNIKSGVDIFGKLGTHAPLVGDDVEGAEGALEIAIPAANYPAGKTATAKDADLTAANIKSGVEIFGVEGTLVAVDRREMVFRPNVGGDDCYITTPSTINNARDYIRIGDQVGADSEAAIRMPKIDIAPGSTITEAFIRIKSYNEQAATDCNVKVHFNDVDDAVAPTTYAGFFDLSLDAGVEWNALGAWVVGTEDDSPSLVSALQAIIDRESWAQNNAIQIVIKNNGSTYAARRYGFSIEANVGQDAVKLYAKWTEP